MQQQQPRHGQNNNDRGSNTTSSAILNIVGHGIYTASLAVNPTQHVRQKKVEGKLAAARIVGLAVDCLFLILLLLDRILLLNHRRISYVLKWTSVMKYLPKKK